MTKLNIYFTTGDKTGKYFSLLQQYGNVLTEGLVDDNIDIVIIDVSIPSLDIGFILGLCYGKGRKLLCLSDGYVNSYHKTKRYTDLQSFDNAVKKWIQKEYSPRSIILSGSPGSGKTTVGKALSSFVHISIGDILRNIAKKDNDMKLILDQGLTIDPHLMGEILKPILYSKEVLTKGYILDGYPPTKEDKKVLDNLLQRRVKFIFYFNLPDELCVKRQIERKERSTDNEKQALERTLLYRKNIPSIETLYEWFPLSPVLSMKENIVENITNVLDIFDRKHNSPYYPGGEQPIYSKKQKRFRYHIYGKGERTIFSFAYSIRKDISNMKIYPIDVYPLGSIGDDEFIVGILGGEYNEKMMKDILDHSYDLGDYQVQVEESLLCGIIRDEKNSEKKGKEERYNDSRKDVVVEYLYKNYILQDIPRLQLELSFSISKKEEYILPTVLSKYFLVEEGWLVLRNDTKYKYVTKTSFLGTEKEGKEKIRKEAFLLRDVLQDKFRQRVDVKYSVEIVHAVWVF